jgi:hypothetical protein
MLQAVFHAPGAVSAYGLKISVDKACLLMAQQTAGGATRLTVSNPLNLGGTVNVSINGSVTAVELPEGLAAGSSVTREIQ